MKEFHYFRLNKDQEKRLMDKNVNYNRCILSNCDFQYLQQRIIISAVSRNHKNGLRLVKIIKNAALAEWWSIIPYTKSCGFDLW